MPWIDTTLHYVVLSREATKDHTLRLLLVVVLKVLEVAMSWGVVRLRLLGGVYSERDITAEETNIDVSSHTMM